MACKLRSQLFWVLCHAPVPALIQSSLLGDSSLTMEILLVTRDLAVIPGSQTTWLGAGAFLCNDSTLLMGRILIFILVTSTVGLQQNLC